RIPTGDLGSHEDPEIVIKTTTETPPARFRTPFEFHEELDDHTTSCFAPDASSKATLSDAQHGYMQLLLSPESQEKCGWANHRGTNQFVNLPFGFMNAGAYFSRAISRVLAGLEANCLAYLDDIVIFDEDFPSQSFQLSRQPKLR
ncbi:hypothetical protein TELCIR_19476, partial [Teladorsagia circumcincta]